MGAAQAQGYFFDKPMPLDALTRAALAPRNAPSTIL
jgi:EAL domain-containing protein (putative c-di-GMP-specific phosphodiesterase class I)